MSLMQKYSTVFKLIPNHSDTNLTNSFKNSGRTQMHSFGARYIRPMHDLDYTKPILQYSPNKNEEKSRSKSKKSSKNPENSSQFRIKSLVKSSSAPRNIINNKVARNGIKIHNYLFKNTSQTIPLRSREEQFARTLELKQFQKGNRSGPFFQTISKYRESTFGLSDKEIQETIMGKINRRTSHHINFKKMPDRPVNVNKVWYNKNQIFSPLDRQRNQSLKQKIHPFKSDSPHQAFEAKESLDKFYQPSVHLIKKRSDAVIRPLDKVKSRPGLQKKLGTNLEYEKNRSLQNKKKPMFKIMSQQERKLSFPRQIISPKKGAYR